MLHTLQVKPLNDVELRTVTSLYALFNESSLPLICGDEECMEALLAPLKGGQAQVVAIKQVILSLLVLLVLLLVLLVLLLLPFWEGRVRLTAL